MIADPRSWLSFRVGLVSATVRAGSSDMTLEIQVDNIKCGGCANTIRTKLEEAFETPVSVDIEQGVVRIDASEARRQEIVAGLASLGYPETGTAEGIEAATAKAKSFVSCAIGRMRGTDND